MNTPEKEQFLVDPNEYESTHENPAASWMATERECIGDILVKNTTSEDGTLPADVAALAAANYRSALAWRDHGNQLLPSSKFEPIAQINWQMGAHSPSPQLIDGVAAAADYIALTAPTDMTPLLPLTVQDDYNAIANSLEAILLLIFGSFMPWSRS